MPTSEGAGGAPAWSVNQNFASRWLREFSAISTSSSWVRSVIAAGVPVAPGTSPNAERMPPALACVSATSYSGFESRTKVAPAVTSISPSGLTSAVRITIGESAVGRAVGVAAEQGQGAGVVAPALGLVLVDQPARVLDRSPGHRGGEHRVSQDVAHVRSGCDRRGGTRCARDVSSA